MNEKEDENMDGKQERLVEIYKLQAQLTNSVSNRRTTTNRFLYSGNVWINFDLFYFLAKHRQITHRITEYSIY